MMKSRFRIVTTRDIIDFNVREFKDGAIQVTPVCKGKEINSDDAFKHLMEKPLKDYIKLEASIKDTQGLIALGQIKNMIDNVQFESRHLDTLKVHCELGYMPFSRYDRSMFKNDAFSLKLVCNMINDMKFDRVIVRDPHSNVTELLLNNIVIIPQEECIMAYSFDFKSRYDAIVSPDAGALKKIEKVAKRLDFDFTKIINCGKVRDIKTGNIIRTDVYDNVQDKKLLLVDDICDGGRTFIQLAKILKEKGAKSVDLYVTHGMFFYGFDVLYEEIDNIYCYYLWDDGKVESNNRLAFYKTF